MGKIEIINLNLKDYCNLLDNEDYHFRNNFSSRMYLKDNKIWKFDTYERFSIDSPVIDYKEELEKYDVNIPRELIYVEGKYAGYTLSFINGFDLATPTLPSKILEYTSKDTLYKSYQRAQENLSKIGELGFDISRDLFDRNIMFDFDKQRFYFIDFDDWEHYKLDVKNDLSDLIVLNTIKTRNKENFDKAINKSMILTR